MVLDDLLRNMFQSSFVSELFHPQRVYSIPSTRNVFQKIAHSSIMRLSTDSMEKLYDLMLMGLKYQVGGLFSSSPPLCCQKSS